MRLDIWLWRARFYKTRKLSAEQISKRGVRLSRNGQTRRINKPATTITVGDVVTFGKSVHIKSVEVVSVGARRGPPDEARSLYKTWEADL
ncbi:MAG: S4 domain-containing protein [Pseudomonadota bacterium]